MNRVSKHISASFILLLFLFYSTPLSFFHHCQNFNRHEHHDGIHQAHQECKICEIQILPFDENTHIVQAAAHRYNIVLTCVQAHAPLYAYVGTLNNKGPPSGLSC